jgi:hypothetical protein
VGREFEPLRAGQTTLVKERTMISQEENQTIAAKREQQRASDAAVAEFLARGGEIQQIPAGKSGAVSGGGSMWGRGRKKAAAPEEAAEIAETTTLAEDAAFASNASNAIDAEELSGEPVFPENPEDFALDDDEEEQ